MGGKRGVGTWGGGGGQRARASCELGSGMRNATGGAGCWRGGVEDRGRMGEAVGGEGGFNDKVDSDVAGYQGCAGALDGKVGRVGWEEVGGFSAYVDYLVRAGSATDGKGSTGDEGGGYGVSAYVANRVG